MDASFNNRLDKLIKLYKKNAVACDRIVFHNRPNEFGENADGDESYARIVGAQAQKWLWLQVAGDLEQLKADLANKASRG